jgi:hypothetical protein
MRSLLANIKTGRRQSETYLGQKGKLQAITKHIKDYRSQNRTI